MNEAPLQGLLVLELASVLAGPSVGMFFAEMGARVIKVENLRTAGDVTRTWRLKDEPDHGDRSSYFCAINWGKESIALDLSQPAAQQIVHQIAARADIVLASYKPGDAEKLRMDADTLRALNPRLIHASLSAYGPDDPRPGFDAIIQAEAGFTYMNGTPDSGPVKMPVALMDLLAAHQLKEACLTALFRRATTGQGATITANLLQSGLASLANQATNYLVAGHIPQPIGSEHPNIVPYGTIYPTADQKRIVLAVGSDAQFRSLCAVLGMPALADDPAYARNGDRVRHRIPLNAQLTQRIQAHPRDALLAALAQAHVPAGAVHDMAEALDQPQAHALMLSGDGLRGLRTVAFQLDGQGQRPLSPPPALHGQGDALLAEFCGMGDDKIAALKAEGVVGHG